MPSGIPPEFKIGVIGSINRDTIIRPDGSRVESYGGILYNLKFLCATKSITVKPAANIGQDHYRPIMRILKSFKNIDLNLVNKVEAPNNHCFMNYQDQVHRCEILKGGVPALGYARVRPLKECHLILINFITGNDIKLAALEKLRSEYNGLIYVDIHSLTLGGKKVRGGYRRYLRRPRYWRRYASCADILQLNRMEFELIANEPFSAASAVRFFRKELGAVKCLNITTGASGSFLVYRMKKIMGRKVSAPVLKYVRDTTGCGDIYSAGFIAEFLHTGSFVRAAACGNRLAAGRCRLKGPVF